ncbi:MAG: SRPBCC domain-containing protein [Bacteroidetes bacterium]|nr:SRPBCC domain-containing protein [Bacteroidota bacterium]
MNHMRYSVVINAPVATVWSTMLEDATYRQWTEGFAPGCYYSGDWKQGSKILFLAPGEHGDSGMVSRIKENKHHEFISIEHLGIVGNGIEDTTSEEAKAWAGALENYTFREKAGMTELLIELKGNIPDEFVTMFDGMWPEALNKLKSLAEN